MIIDTTQKAKKKVKDFCNNHKSYFFDFSFYYFVTLQSHERENATNAIDVNPNSSAYY